MNEPMMTFRRPLPSDQSSRRAFAVPFRAQQPPERAPDAEKALPIGLAPLPA